MQVFEGDKFIGTKGKYKGHIIEAIAQDDFNYIVSNNTTKVEPLTIPKFYFKEAFSPYIKNKVTIPNKDLKKVLISIYNTLKTFSEKGLITPQLLGLMQKDLWKNLIENFSEKK